MKIGIISDTHGDYEAFCKSMEILGDSDYIIHCGDILPIYSRKNLEPFVELLAEKISKINNILLVEGNGDYYRRDLIKKEIHSPYLFLEVDKYKIFATHGDRYSRISMIMKAKELGANILCYGHTHIKELDFDNEIIILNPGSTSIPRDNTKSCATIENDTITMYNILDESIIAKIKI